MPSTNTSEYQAAVVRSTHSLHSKGASITKQTLPNERFENPLNHRDKKKKKIQLISHCKHAVDSLQ